MRKINEQQAREILGGFKGPIQAYQWFSTNGGSPLWLNWYVPTTNCNWFGWWGKISGGSGNGWHQYHGTNLYCYNH